LNIKIIFAVIGTAMTVVEAIFGIYLYFIFFIINFIYLGIGLLAFGCIIFIILMKTDYDPFQEYSCWAFLLSIGFIALAFGYFPWNVTGPYLPMGLYSASVCFSWAAYLTGWNFYALTRKKEQIEAPE